jgi:hypothetical protein
LIRIGQFPLIKRHYLRNGEKKGEDTDQTRLSEISYCWVIKNPNVIVVVLTINLVICKEAKFTNENKGKRLQKKKTNNKNKNDKCYANSNKL